MAKQPPRGSFGKIAIDSKYITEEGLREAMQIQEQLLRETGEKVNLGKILLDKGFMTKEQILDVLSIQAKDIHIEGFEIHSKLGAGNMGAVYHATHLASKRQVALKVISNTQNTERFIKRFEVEFDVLQKLKHPNIVEAISFDKNASIPYYAMEFVEGKTLRDILKQYEKLPVKDALDIIRVVSMALQYAKSHGIFHRDIKPDNLLIANYDRISGKVDGLKIIDFGLAKDTDADSGLTMEGTGMGTPLYMAPEQVKDAKNVDFRADIYSLGATLFRMLTGHNAAFGKSSMEIVANVVKGNIRSMKDFDQSLPEHVYTLVDKMMSLQVQKRYQNYESLVKDVDAIIYTELKNLKRQKKAQSAESAKIGETLKGTAEPANAKENIAVVDEEQIHAYEKENTGTFSDLFDNPEKTGTSFHIVPGINNRELLNFAEPIFYILVLLLCFFF